MSGEHSGLMWALAAAVWLVAIALMAGIFVRRSRRGARRVAEGYYDKAEAWFAQILGDKMPCDGNFILLAGHEEWKPERTFETGRAWDAYLEAGALLRGHQYILWQPFWQLKEAASVLSHALQVLRVQDVPWALVVCVDEVEDGDILAAIARMKEKFGGNRVLIRSEEFTDRLGLESQLLDAGFRVVHVPDGAIAIGDDENDLCLVVANRRVILWPEVRKS